MLSRPATATLRVCLCLSLSLSACGGEESEKRAEPVPTTLVRYLDPVPRPGGGFDIVPGPGEPHRVLDLAEGAESPEEGRFWSLAYWFVATDQHIADEESPARLAFFDAESVFFGMLTDGYGPQEDLSPHLWNATVLTADAMMRDFGRSFDMAVLAGDGSDNGSAVEMQWFVEALDPPAVGFIRPDTGDWNIVDGHDLGERNLGSQESHDPYDRPGQPNSNADFPVTGLQNSKGERIPWYGVVGNHDALHMGNFTVDDPRFQKSPLNNFFYGGSVWVGALSPFGYLRGMPTLLINTLDGGTTPPQEFYDSIGGPELGGRLSDPKLLRELMPILTDGEAAVRAEIDPNFDFDQIIPDPYDPATSRIGVEITGDESRRFVGTQGLIDLLRAGGHGFSANEDECNRVFPHGVDPGMGYYTLDSTSAAGASIPIRSIFLNTSEYPIAAAEGGISAVQHRWLKCQLERVQRDQRLAVVVSHHPENEIAFIEGELPEVPVCVGLKGCEKVLTDLFHGTPNLVLHIVGHGHVNRITPHPAASGSEAGYWEVQSPSTSWWPQQSRVIEIVAYANSVGEIWNTVIDHSPRSPSRDVNTLTELGRALALNDPQLPLDTEGKPSGGGKTNDRNQVLRFSIPPDVMSAIAELAPSRTITSRDTFPGGALPPPPTS